MKNSILKIFCSSFFFFTGFSTGARPPVTSFQLNDRDISGPPQAPIRVRSMDLTPDHVEVSDESQPLSVSVYREIHGQWTSVGGLRFTPTQSCSRVYRNNSFLVAPLTDDKIEVSRGGPAYRIVTANPCRGKLKIFFNESSEAGQAVGTWQLAFFAKEKLRREIGLQFWKKQLRFVWPSSGDYYDGSVNVSRGDHWDVVGHEMGHAIYDFGQIGVFGGGQHLIDQCYTEALALSEGWASFFSAWVSVELKNPDARFEYMVPRRAPIRFENIPRDVCTGPSNEWRVLGFFWDLIDLNADREQASLTFKFVWDSLFQSRSRSVIDSLQRIISHGGDPELLRQVRDVNLYQPTRR